jgi:UDP-N-acetylmuramoyl-tripeptide--D-alanyl-D-alanine ligase
MNVLWTIEDLLDATGGRPYGSPPPSISGISIDSRTTGKGDAFFAIKGERFDGHDFASAALANGASVLVVSEAKLPALGRLKAPMIVVDDVLGALEKLGAAARARTKAQIVAVTGSVGKTTTKSMLRHVLSACGPTHAAVASFNNHWGVPLTLARMPEETRFGVFEIGMNHPGEITPLVKMVRPHVAIITTIAAAHLGNFKNLNEIAAAKAEIFSGLVSGGHALLNRDNEKFAMLKKAAKAAGITRIHGFGEHKQADFRLRDAEYGAASSKIIARIGNRDVKATIGVAGRHIVQNALAVLAAAKLVGADVERAAASLADYQAEKGRGARYQLAVPGGTVTLIDESYNANPASMRAALSLLADAAPGEGGRRIAVLGDMLELGKFSEKLHAELAEPVVTAGVDRVFLAGPEMQALKIALPSELPAEQRETAAELVPIVTEELRAGDIVMVKSSLGIGFGKIVAALLDKFPTVPEAEPEGLGEVKDGSEC